MHPRRIPIVFATSPVPSEPPCDRTGRPFTRLFGCSSPPAVLRTPQQQPKTEGILRAIRILRSPISGNERPFSPGRCGEEILADSAD